MGSTERRAKEKEELRTLILQAARRLFVEKGIEQTTIRSIAEAIDYSIGTVYVYFKDKNAILHALHSQGFAELGGQFRVLSTVADPMERLRAMGRIYVRFAIQQPDMYDLMFTVKAPITYADAREQPWDEGMATFDELRATVKACMEANYFGDHDLDPLVLMIWGVVHGLCSLYIGQRIKGVGQSDTPASVEKAYDEFLKLIE